MRSCTHARAGIVTNHNPAEGMPPRGMAHGSRSVCAREACIEDAIGKVARDTNMTAAYYPDTRPGGPRDPAKVGTRRG